jgi:hypothetical protein
VCCILQGPFIGKEVTLTNIIQGSCARRGRAGFPGVIAMITLGNHTHSGSTFNRS